MTDKEQQQVVQLAKKFIREMHPKEIKENPALRVYLIEGFIAGYCAARRTATSKPNTISTKSPIALSTAHPSLE